MTEQLHDKIEWIDFEVQVPTLDGEGIAEVHTIKVPARKSLSGRWILTPDALDQIEQTQARYMGLMTPTEIKALRLHLQFTQREMSEIIQAGEKSYTRWENGNVRLSRLVNIILCAIRDGFLPLTYLRTLYEHGSDWYKKVKLFEEHQTQPTVYKLKLISKPPEVKTAQPVVSPTHSASCGVGCESNWLLRFVMPCQQPLDCT